MHQNLLGVKESGYFLLGFCLFIGQWKESAQSEARSDAGHASPWAHSPCQQPARWQHEPERRVPPYPHSLLSAVHLEALQGLYICKHLPAAAPQRAHSANRSSHPCRALAAEVTRNLFLCIRELVMCPEGGGRCPPS